MLYLNANKTLPDMSGFKRLGPVFYIHRRLAVWLAITSEVSMERQHLFQDNTFFLILIKVVKIASVVSHSEGENLKVRFWGNNERVTTHFDADSACGARLFEAVHHGEMDTVIMHGCHKVISVLIWICVIQPAQDWNKLLIHGASVGDTVGFGQIVAGLIHKECEWVFAF